MYIKELEFYLTVVRHGQTMANLCKTIQGHTNTPLTELGLEQAKALAEHFRLTGPNNFDHIYTSDLSRAYETCLILTKGCCETSKQIVNKEMRLRERQYGSMFEGKPVNELKVTAYGLGYNDENFTQFTPNGAESMEDVRNRIEDFLINALSKVVQHNQEVLIVTHWATIKEILKFFQPKANGSITSDHLVETPNTAFCRFKVCLRSVNKFKDQTDREKTEQTIKRVDVISLHQTPHLSMEQVSINLRGVMN